jgi:zinc transporter ZupT
MRSAYFMVVSAVEALVFAVGAGAMIYLVYARS